MKFKLNSCLLEISQTSFGLKQTLGVQNIKEGGIKSLVKRDIPGKMKWEEGPKKLKFLNYQGKKTKQVQI